MIAGHPPKAANKLIRNDKENSLKYFLQGKAHNNSSKRPHSLKYNTLQSSYNFTNSRVATHLHAWLHAKSCRVPRLVAACPTPCQRVVTHKKLPCATLNSCVSHVYGCSRVVLAT